MRKLSILPPALMLLAGIVGAWLRKIQLDTIFDYVTGLAEPMAPVTVKFLILSAAAAAVCIFISLISAAKYTANVSYKGAFHISSFVTFTLYALLGAGISVMSVFWLMENVPAIIQISTTQLLFFVLAFFSGISIILSAISMFTGKNLSATRFFGVMPCLFFCVWLLEIYRINRTNPVLLDYYLLCLAYASACLGFFYSAGFIFERSSPRLTMLFNTLSIYLCTAALADNFSMFEQILLMLFIAVQFINTVLFNKNLHPKQKQPDF